MFSPSPVFLDLPLTVGKQWQCETLAINIYYGQVFHTYPATFTFTVTGAETISTPAGNFETLELEVWGVFTGPQPAAMTRSVYNVYHLHRNLGPVDEGGYLLTGWTGVVATDERDLGRGQGALRPLIAPRRHLHRFRLRDRPRHAHAAVRLGSAHPAVTGVSWRPWSQDGGRAGRPSAPGTRGARSASPVTAGCADPSRITACAGTIPQPEPVPLTDQAGCVYVVRVQRSRGGDMASTGSGDRWLHAEIPVIS